MSVFPGRRDAMQRCAERETRTETSTNDSGDGDTRGSSKDPSGDASAKFPGLRMCADSEMRECAHWNDRGYSEMPETEMRRCTILTISEVQMCGHACKIKWDKLKHARADAELGDMEITRGRH